MTLQAGPGEARAELPEVDSAIQLPHAVGQHAIGDRGEGNLTKGGLVLVPDHSASAANAASKSVSNASGARPFRRSSSHASTESLCKRRPIAAPSHSGRRSRGSTGGQGSRDADLGFGWSRERSNEMTKRSDTRREIELRHATRLEPFEDRERGVGGHLESSAGAQLVDDREQHGPARVALRLQGVEKPLDERLSVHPLNHRARRCTRRTVLAARRAACLRGFHRGTLSQWGHRARVPSPTPSPRLEVAG